MYRKLVGIYGYDAAENILNYLKGFVGLKTIDGGTITEVVPSLKGGDWIRYTEKVFLPSEPYGGIWVEGSSQARLQDFVKNLAL